VWCGSHRSRLLAGGLTWLALLAGASAAAAADNVNYNGGPVAHSMTGVIVDWGAGINPMYTNETSGDPGLIKYLSAESGSTSDIGGVLGQYMDSSGQNAANRDSYGGQFQITPSLTQTTVSDSQIQTELSGQIQAGHLPHPGGNGLSTIYLVNFPGGDTECIDSQTCSANAPDQSTQDFCAYHSSTQLPDGTHVLYAVLPDNTTGHMSQWCGQASSLLGDQTSYLSHEWSETISDPLGNAWWVNNASSADNGNEIGDNCNQLMSVEGGWTVQQEWSNLDHNCVGGEPAYAAPTASFLSPGIAQPGQAVSFDASSSSDPSADATAISATNYSIASGLSSYTWNWGDGTSSTGATPAATHTYATLGNYQVSLTVTDHLGFTSTLTRALAVTSDGSPSPSPSPAPTPTPSTGTPTPVPPQATTPPAATPAVNATPLPFASTGSAARVTGSTARISGSVNPEGTATSYHVEFGTTIAYGHSTPSTAAGARAASVPVTVALSGLSPRTTYHYRVVATNEGGTSVGADRTFTTGGAPHRAPRFSFVVPRSVAARAALRGRLRVRFSCSRACASHFVVTVASAQATRFAPVAITLARGTGRVGARGTGRARLRFMPGVARRLLAQRGVKLLVLGYAVAPGSAPSAPRMRRVVLS
jgi:hypothetical protein